MPNSRNPISLKAAFIAAILTSSLHLGVADAQQSVPRDQVRQARANWAPVRTKKAANATTNKRNAPTALQPKSSRGAQATRPTQRRKVSSAAQGDIQQAAYQVPSPPPMPEEIIYEPAVVDGSCDAIGGSCGCDAVGCDGIGACGPSCGCSMCGEIPSLRAWRPALTLSLPQDGWFSFEGLVLYGDGMRVPPLVSSSPVGTDQDDAGVLPGATILYGGPENDLFTNSGDAFRLQFGFWLDRCHNTGLGVDYIELDQRREGFSGTSTGDPILARPFFNTVTGMEDSELVAFNNGADIQLTGTVSVAAQQEFGTAGFYVRRMLCCNEGCRRSIFCNCAGKFCSRTEFRVGYRYTELKEAVVITEDLQNNGTSSAGRVNTGRFDIVDAFRTRNQFNGIDLAWSQRFVRGYWTLEGLVRLGIGNNRQQVTVAGRSTILDLSDPNNASSETYDAGLLALSTNSGLYERDQFAVFPELNITVGYQLTDHLKAKIGYTGLYFSNVVRPGEHIPRDVNTNFLPPEIAGTASPRPLFAFDTTDYWIQGLSYGLEYQW